MKILVTGANGFVGSHIVEELVAQGHEVSCLVRPTSDRRWLSGCNVTYCVGDISRTESLHDALHGVEAVVHAAGIVRARRIETYYEINQKATENLVRAVLEHNPSLKRFIFISSQAAMGPSDGPSPKPLTAAETPVSDYGKSKLAGEREVAQLNNRVPYTILRPASVYGPRDKDIFIFFDLVRRGLRPRTVSPRLIHLVFVKDVARAVTAALQNDRTGAATYFLAEDTAYSWESVAQAIADAVDRKTLPLPLPDTLFRAASLAAEIAAHITGKAAVLNRQKIREMLQPCWLGDNSAARKDLGIDFTNLKIGAKITYLWYQQNNWF